MSKHAVTLPGGLPLGFRLSVHNEDQRFYAVSKIRQNSKAERSGLRKGDVVLCVNGISCENISHETITALTDISDTLNLLVLRNVRDLSEVIAAFSSLDQSVRHLTQPEIAELTKNPNMIVARRQSTGCISQMFQNGQHKNATANLLGAHKLKHTSFIDSVKNVPMEGLDDLKLESEEKSFVGGDKLDERRRRGRSYKTDNTSEKRHIVSSRWKNMAQTTEILEKELEDEIRSDYNLQMFKKTSDELVNPTLEPLQGSYPTRKTRCSSEEPRYLTNMKFNLSTDEIKQTPKVPAPPIKISIRRFSLVTPCELARKASQNEVQKNKLNITPVQIKTQTTPTILRRARLSIPSNSLTEIRSEELAVRRNDTSDIRRQECHIKNENPRFVNKDEKHVDVKSPSIAFSSTKQKLIPASRTRSNSLCVMSTARNFLSSKIERSTNFSLQTGKKFPNNDVQDDVKFPSKTEGVFVKNILDDDLLKSQNSSSIESTDKNETHNLTNKDKTVVESQSLKDANVPVSNNQIIKGRKFSFSSRSRTSNLPSETKMVTNTIKLGNKPSLIGSNISRKESNDVRELLMGVDSKFRAGSLFFEQKESKNLGINSPLQIPPRMIATPKKSHKILTQDETIDVHRDEFSKDYYGKFRNPSYVTPNNELLLKQHSNKFQNLSHINQHSSKPDFTHIQSTNSALENKPYQTLHYKPQPVFPNSQHKSPTSCQKTPYIYPRSAFHNQQHPLISQQLSHTFQRNPTEQIQQYSILPTTDRFHQNFHKSQSASSNPLNFNRQNNYATLPRRLKPSGNNFFANSNSVP